MEDRNGNQMLIIGDRAPSFHALTTQGEISFPKDYSGKWVVLFCYEADFTAVCTTELMILASMQNEFRGINTELIGLSGDSIYSHIAWIRKIKELAWKDTKHVEVAFPLISDCSMEISKKYAVLAEENIKIKVLNTTYLIDPEGKIRAAFCYPREVGRNILEIKRLIMALQKVDSEGAAVPGNWLPEEDVLLLPPETTGQAAERMDLVSENQYCMDWFLSFRQSEIEADSKEKEPEANPYPSAYPIRRRTSNRR